VDTQGLILKVQLTSAQVADSVGAKSLLDSCRQQFPRLGIIWADQSYRGPLVEWMQEQHRLRLEIVYRTSPEQRKAQVWETARKRQRAGASVIEMWSGLSWQGQMEVLPKRWVVERTFAWLGKYRRLSKDYEQLPQTGEAWIYLAMTRLMLRRLAKIKSVKGSKKPALARRK
jgi:putative transposase